MKSSIISTKLSPCNIQRIFSKEKKIHSKIFDIVNIFAQNIREVVQTSTHTVCFESKIRKLGIPLQTPVVPYKSGVWGNVLVMDMLS